MRARYVRRLLKKIRIKGFMLISLASAECNFLQIFFVELWVFGGA